MVKTKKQTLPKEVDVLIVGGGLAGLSCAVGLCGQGLRIAVLEKDCILGGRASSWKESHSGDDIHLGPHILLSAYPNMLSFLKKLGTDKDIMWLGKRFMHLVDGQESYEISISNLPPPLHFLPSMLSDPLLSKRDLLIHARVTWLVMQLGEDELLGLDDLNAAAFLRGMGVSSLMLERFWSFVCMSILNVPLKLCSHLRLCYFMITLTIKTLERGVSVKYFSAYKI
jgi:15-cis-phytoene desaturase